MFDEGHLSRWMGGESVADLDQRREEQLLRCVPDVIDPGTVLYVGGKPERLQMINVFASRGATIDVMEAWRPNVDALVAWNVEKKIFRTIIRGNIRRIGDIPVSKYDVVMFWHGPEHVAREDLPFVLLNMEAIATRLVILASPWGRYFQDSINGNPFEKHVSHLYPIDFEAFGYRVDAIGAKDKKGSNLLAWKRVG